jgi:hypothetical protein
MFYRCGTKNCPLKLVDRDRSREDKRIIHQLITALFVLAKELMHEFPQRNPWIFSGTDFFE